MGLFGRSIIRTRELVVLKWDRCMINAYKKENALQANEIRRLREIEAKYNRLTDRNEKGRFVRRAATKNKGVEKHGIS